MTRARWNAASLALLAGLASACIRVDPLPAAAPAGEPEGETTAPVRVSGRSGAVVASACEGAPLARDRAWACISFASYYEQGIFGLPQDLAKAASLRESATEMLEASCDRGDITDCTRAAVVIGMSVGLGRSTSEASEEATGWMLEYARQGCNGGDAKGCALLGLIHEKGRGVAVDFVRAARYYDEACGKGHLRSCLVIAQRAAAGRPAVLAYERACQAGSGFACAAAAQHHARGVGVAQSTRTAGDLFVHGCSLGNPAACVMGAELLQSDDTEGRRATRLAWEACNIGIPDGCLLLGEMIERDHPATRAFEVYHHACELGDRRGCAAEKRVRRAADEMNMGVIDLDEVRP